MCPRELADPNTRMCNAKTSYFIFTFQYYFHTLLHSHSVYTMNYEA